MAYKLLESRTSADRDGRMFPVPSEADGLVELEPADGTQVLRAEAVGVRVQRRIGREMDPLMRISGVRAQILVTDARLAVVCHSSGKGAARAEHGRGGPAAAVLTVVSRAYARQPIRDRILVGHVRYPWLSCVGFSACAGPGTRERLRLGLVDALKRELYVDLELAEGADAGALAQTTARRAAAYRLRYDGAHLDEHLRGLFEAMTHTARLAPAAQRFVVYQMPSYTLAGPDTAYPSSPPAPRAASGAQVVGAGSAHYLSRP